MASKQYDGWKYSADAYKQSDPRKKDRASGKLLEGKTESNAYGRGITWDELDAMFAKSLNEKKKKKQGGQS